jgi:hypothetical protein
MPAQPTALQEHPHHPNFADVRLLLRAHAEEVWLRRRVLPVVGELEDGTAVPEEQLGAALAYLEVMWLEALARAAETDAAGAALVPDPARSPGPATLCFDARRLHATVKALRMTVRPRVLALTAPVHGLLAHDAVG